MKKPKLHQGLSWSKGPQSMIDRELRDQASPEERGRRLRAWAERVRANTLDGATALPDTDNFKSARLIFDANN